MISLIDRPPAVRRETASGEMIAVGPGKPEWLQTVLPWNTTVMFRNRWDEAQADFVDDPRSAMERADALVADAMQRLADELAAQRAEIEAAWKDDHGASTEELRLAFQRYRSFLARLVSL
jgi:hypothetical protein